MVRPDSQAADGLLGGTAPSSITKTGRVRQVLPRTLPTPAHTENALDWLARMKITRLYSGPDGESHFEEVELETQAGRSGGLKRSDAFPAKAAMFAEVGDSVFHTAPARQFAVVLRGQTEIFVGDGTSRVFKAGDVFLAEDMTGRGHRSTAQGAEILFITLQ